MYIHKQDPVDLRVAVRNTREADRDTFKLERYQNQKYKNSLYFKGAEMWKCLQIYVTRSDCLFQFKTEVKQLYSKYKSDD